MNLDLDVLNVVVLAAVGSVLIPLSLILVDLKRQPPEMKWLASILVLSFCCDALAILLYKLFHFPTNLWGNLYNILHLPLLSCFFYSFMKGKTLKNTLIVFNVLYLIFCASNLFFIQKLSINTYSTIPEKLLVMFLSIAYFYRLLTDLPAAKIYEIGLFWVVSSLFITESAKLVVFSFVNYLITAYQDNLIIMWLIHNSMSVLCHLAMAWGVHLNNRSRRLALAKV